MFLVIPSIELRGDYCVRKKGKSFERESVYFDDPVKMAQLWRLQNARSLHIQGRDEGDRCRHSVLRKLCSSVDIPVQLRGGLTSIKRIESAFSAAYDANPEMFMRASDKQIVIVSPTTLLVTLRTIQTIWRYEYQNRNAEKIAAQAGGIYDQFALVVESLDEVGRNIDKAKESFEHTHKRISTGKGNLVRRVTRLEELGARNKKKLPASLVQHADDSSLLEDTH